MQSTNIQEIYGEDYYENYGVYSSHSYSTGPHIATLTEIADVLIKMCHPKSILDVGCAMNVIVKRAVTEYKIEDAIGIDVSEYALRHSFMPQNQILLNIGKPFNLGRKFDLVTCIETIEHLTYAETMVALDNIVNHAAKYIYFTSNPQDFTEPAHITVLPREFWIAEFAKRGFECLVDYKISEAIPWEIFLLNTSLKDGVH